MAIYIHTIDILGSTKLINNNQLLCRRFQNSITISSKLNRFHDSNDFLSVDPFL